MISHEELMEEIFSESWDYLEELKKSKKGRTVYYNSDRIKQIFDIVIKLENKSNNFSADDIHDFIASQTNCQILTEFKDKLNSYLSSTVETFEFYFNIGRSLNFPFGYEIGTGKLYPYNKLPVDVQQHFPNSDGTSASGNKHNECWYMHITIESVGDNKAIEKAYEQYQRNISIYKFAYLSGSYFPKKGQYRTRYVAKISDRFLNVAYDFTPYELNRNEEYDNLVSSLSEIVTGKETTDLKVRIIGVIDLYGMIQEDTPLHIRFTLCVIALESVLLSGDDKDSSIRKKLAEKLLSY